MLPEIRAYLTRARLRRGIEMVKLANRIEALKMQEEDPENSDMPKDATLAADQTRHFSPSSHANHNDSDSVSAPAASPPAGDASGSGSGEGGKRTLSKTIKGAIFREVVLAKVREMKEQEETLKVTEEASKTACRDAVGGGGRYHCGDPIRRGDIKMLVGLEGGAWLFRRELGGLFLPYPRTELWTGLFWHVLIS